MRSYVRGRVARVLRRAGWALVHAGDKVDGTETSWPVAQVYALAYEKATQDTLRKVARRRRAEQ